MSQLPQAYGPILSLFDLDGTITDSKQGIIIPSYILEPFRIRASADSLLFFIGPPLKQSFARYFPGDSARVALAVEKYREYFRRQGMFENQVHPGKPQMLERLIEQGHRNPSGYIEAGGVRPPILTISS